MQVCRLYFSSLLFSLLLLAAPLLAQKAISIQEFEISEGKPAELIIEKAAVKVVYLSSGSRQTLVDNFEEISQVAIRDINGDGFSDIMLNFTWKYGHTIGEIFLYHPDQEAFKALLIEAKTPLLDAELTKEGAIRIYQHAVSSYASGWEDYLFFEPFKVFKSGVTAECSMPGLGMALSKFEQYSPDGKLESRTLFQNGAEVENLYAYIEAEKTELYAEPSFSAARKGYLIKDDEVSILDFTTTNWLKIRFYNTVLKKNIEGWINTAEMLLSKHDLLYRPETKAEDVSLNLLYPYYPYSKTHPRYGKDSMFVFSIGINNHSQSNFSIGGGRVFLLLQDQEGRRYLYDLYGTHSETLPPKSLKDTYGQSEEGGWYVPSILLDDNAVEWDDTLQKYLIFHSDGTQETYPEFVPATLPAGAYTLHAIFYKPYGNAPPLVSNPQEIILPLPRHRAD